MDPVTPLQLVRKHSTTSSVTQAALPLETSASNELGMHRRHDPFQCRQTPKRNKARRGTSPCHVLGSATPTMWQVSNHASLKICLIESLSLASTGACRIALSQDDPLFGNHKFFSTKHGTARRSHTGPYRTTKT